MAETTEHGAGMRRPRSNWVPLAVAAGVVVLLGAGWPLLDAATPSAQELADDHTVDVGAAGDYAASLELPQHGWNMDTTRTMAGRQYVLNRGPIELDLTSVRPPQDVDATPENLWAGMETTSRVHDPSARLGEPESTDTQDGTEGLVGDLHTQGRTERAAVFPSPDGAFAVEMTLGGKDATEADITAVDDVVEAVSFEHRGGS
ncbi:hypothetical protein GCM10007147_03900 [Nocardiopsis kunsanensis]|uniref:Uncharacterized protein n=1 Tax=Nocardiopsis kunsanensis TaxID=141693 RepID=A0A918X6Z7_9ACTN|nr:hypothetical protein [Nocardiopsis kunsanensis]GHD15946.1 hypothetical protein GCM10007147_03900 [Nocardiopsis kunsanensis]